MSQALGKEMHRLCTFLFFVTLSTLVSAQEPVSPPSVLLLRIEGFIGDSYRTEIVSGSGSVIYRHNQETFTDSAGTEEEKIDIPTERWSVFWARLEEAKVWSWKKHYAPSENPPDGTVWTVRIDWDGRKVISSGSNAYPDEKQFALFKIAVVELLGGRKFE